MDETKKSAPREGGEKRSRSRRGRRDGRPRPAQGGQPQQAPKFDPHFLTGAETAVLPAKTVAAAPDKQRPVQPNSQPGRQAKGQQAPQRPGRDSRAPQAPAESKKGGRNAGKNKPQAEPARTETAARQTSRSAGERGRSQAGRIPPAKSPAGSQSKSRPGRPARESRSDDPGLVLISRRPPQQKFSNFEEYMAAHGGATAPIEDHSEDYE